MAFRLYSPYDVDCPLLVYNAKEVDSRIKAIEQELALYKERNRHLEAAMRPVTNLEIITHEQIRNAMDGMPNAGDEDKSLDVCDYYACLEMDNYINWLKRKRCLDMAAFCRVKMTIYNEEYRKFEFWEKWWNKWRRLANNFKGAI